MHVLIIIYCLPQIISGGYAIIHLNTEIVQVTTVDKLGCEPNSV